MCNGIVIHPQEAPPLSDGIDIPRTVNLNLFFHLKLFKIMSTKRITCEIIGFRELTDPIVSDYMVGDEERQNIQVAKVYLRPNAQLMALHNSFANIVREDGKKVTLGVYRKDEQDFVIGMNQQGLDYIQQLVGTKDTTGFAQTLHGAKTDIVVSLREKGKTWTDRRTGEEKVYEHTHVNVSFQNIVLSLAMQQTGMIASEVAKMYVKSLGLDAAAIAGTPTPAGTSSTNLGAEEKETPLTENDIAPDAADGGDGDGAEGDGGAQDGGDDSEGKEEPVEASAEAKKTAKK